MPTTGTRWRASLVGMLIMVSACGAPTLPPPGTDGLLTNEWPAHSRPVQWTPRAPTCHTGYAENLLRSAYAPVDCASDHRFESVYVGRFDDDAGAGHAPPGRHSAAWRAAWADCDRRTTGYLGGQWRDRQLWIGVSVPSDEGWRGGARWYVCQVGAAEWVGNPRIVFTRSIKGGFTNQPELEWGCGHQPDTGDYQVRHCDEPHNAEFAGSFPLHVPFAEAQARYGANDPLFHRGCLRVIAKFVGVPHEGHLPERTGSSYRIPAQADWDDGDRSVRCHLWTGRHQISRSLKGAGAGALPPGTR